MSYSVFKYPITQQHGEQQFWLPKGAEFIGAHVQGGIPTLWFLVDQEAPCACRTIFACNTGDYLAEHPGKPLATFLMDEGKQVAHAFDRGYK